MTTALAANHRDLVLAGPVGSLDAYIVAVNAIPVLSRDEEQELARLFRENNDLNAARRLVMSQLRFVVHIARGYNGYGLPLNDLVQEGNIGLMKAVKRFDPDVGVRLVSFAVHWIRAEIHEYVLKNWRLVKIATTKAQRKLFFNLRKAKTFLGWLSADETKAIANDLGVSAREVTEMEKRLAGHDMAFDPAPSDDEEQAYAPAHYLQDKTPDPAELVESDDWQQQTSGQLYNALQTLDQRSREILQARWLAEKKTTLQELSKRYDVSAERIRQIEQRAIKMLRTELVAQ
ncbi:MAG: RNA polymerase sigma factor RpoH [Gammaproteobacteria bacterium]|jgi:RNA polymerase sigma-32 factor|nr:RNA polymerase sigma factor RpoH [Gammaproteobacteria bacterium]MDP7297339.1 RNA polymerase sigma factor RpoH [Gammaproteobacteria bacterium]MDP7418560.1 RNA polymerase sigma factor RpoH [Gammaproteobacteria bacterium]MDP7659662.1 RNA polymerase sigma factor RpoH [Gammaproteobacteria bacterium]HJP38099.1 RNA polymerase sigma factor RpoH [Gammaproteobacteria bacterium]